MSTRIQTEKGVVVVGETPDEVHEKIRGTSDGFIEVTATGGDLDPELRKPSGVKVTLNITEIILFREKAEEKHEHSLNPPGLSNR